VGGGVVGSGSLKFGKMVQNNLTVDTSDGKWFKY
jgi:alkaline phosphatase D